MLLDRLFSLLNADEVTAVLRGFGWTVQDYQRGYILKVFVIFPREMENIGRGPNCNKFCIILYAQFRTF